MGRRNRDNLDDRVALAVSRLHALCDALPGPVDGLEASGAFETFAENTGGELLFELPADHPNLGESQWAVLRYRQNDEQRFVHMFLSTSDDKCWIGEDSDAPLEFSKFAHAWTDVLTRCVAGLDSYRPLLSAAS